jgi:hypothetical protein
MQVDDITDKVGSSILINSDSFVYDRFNTYLNQFVVFESEKYTVYAHLDCSEVYVYVKKDFKDIGSDHREQKVQTYSEFCNVVSSLCGAIIRTYESTILSGVVT